MTQHPSTVDRPAPGSAEAHRRMRVVFDSAIFLERHFGGVMRYVRELADGVAVELAADSPAGGSVQVLAGLHVAPLVAADFAAGTCSGVRMPAIRGATRAYRWWNDRRLAATLRREPRLPTVLHETLYGATTALPRDVRRVVTVHDLIWEDDPAAAPPLGLRLKAASIAAADGIVFVSEATRRAFGRHYPSPPRSAVIHHGCELRTTRGRRSPGLPWPFILYLGQRCGYKNWDGLVRAVAGSPRLRGHGLVMFGPRPSRREMSFVAAVGHTGLQTSWIQGDDDVLADLYASAACLVYPSRKEGFGMPLVEAARLGCPVACSDIEPFREVLGPDAAYFDPDAGPALEAAVAATVAAGRDAPRVLAAARRTADFTWPSACRHTLDFYRQVLDAA